MLEGGSPPLFFGKTKMKKEYLCLISSTFGRRKSVIALDQNNETRELLARGIIAEIAVPKIETKAETKKPAVKLEKK